MIYLLNYDYNLNWIIKITIYYYYNMGSKPSKKPDPPKSNEA